TLTPMLSSRFLRLADAERDSKTKDMGFFHKVDQWYCASLKWAIAHPMAIGAISVVVFALTFPLNRFVGRSFLPNEDVGNFTVQIDGPEQVSPEGMAALSKAIAHELSGQEGVAHVGILSSNGKTSHAHVLPYLQPLDERKVSQSQVVARMREILK